VEFDSPIYRAPSVPKISRRNISSPIIRGAQSVSAPKLKTSKFSFIRPRIQTPTLTSETSASETLIETNRILVEIQKQLALDFANRITEKREALKVAKIRVNRERAEREESSIEAVNKFGSGIFKALDKVLTPAKSIFQKILDFFSIILTGLILNNAFNWLSKRENREKIKQFFDFVGKYWKELLALFIGFKITKLILKIKRLVDLFGKGPRGGGPRGGTPLDCAGVMKCFSTSVVPFLAANPRVVNQMGQSLLKDRRFLTGLATALGISTLPPKIAPPKPTPTPTTPTTPQPTPTTARPTAQQPTAQPGFDWSGFANSINQVTAAGVTITGALLLSLFQSFAPAAKGGTIGELPKKKCNACSLGFSEGGTVGGTGSGLVDSVRAMLAPGEEVIRTSAAMMFRPLLKDINNNAGRMWITFSNAIRNMVSYNETMRFALDELSRNLETFKKQLDDFVNQEKLEKSKKVGGGGYGLRTPSKDSITTLVLPTTIIHSDLKKPARPATRTTIPITLPTKTANYKMPAIDGGMATDEPDISSVNLANDYMMLTPKMYGIFV
jgi:hypothetical protein